MGRFKPIGAVTSECKNLTDSMDSGKKVVDLLKALDTFNETSVTLDIGSGLGRVERHLAPLVGRCYGADISPSMVGKARRLVPFENVEFTCTNGNDLAPWNDSSIDLVFSFLVFQHLQRGQAEEYLNAAFAKLRPGGTIVFHMMIDEDHVHADPPPSHPYGLRLYSRGDVRGLLARVGFADVSTHEMDGGPDQLQSDGDIVFVAKRPPTP